jgi:hypothetical protein
MPPREWFEAKTQFAYHVRRTVRSSVIVQPAPHRRFLTVPPVLAMQLAFQFLDPTSVLSGFHSTDRARFAETRDRVLLPGLQLCRYRPYSRHQPLIRTPTLPVSLHSRNLARHPLHRRTLRRQQSRHNSVLVRLSISSHFPMSALPRVPILSRRQLL